MSMAAGGFRSLPAASMSWGATDGATRDEALAEARDLLRELIAATMREGKGLPEPSRATKRRPLPGRAAGADCAEGGPLRSVPQGRCVATPSCPRSRRCRERSSAHAESGPCHQVGSDRPRLAPVGQAGQRDRWGGCVMIRDQNGLRCLHGRGMILRGSGRAGAEGWRRKQHRG